MTGVSYHPLYDSYHCVFRSCCLLSYKYDIDIDINRFRIIDFYFLLPFFINDIRLSGVLRDVRREKDLNKIPLPYQHVPSRKSLFRALVPVQDVALRHQVAVGLIDGDAFRGGRFKRGLNRVPEGSFHQRVNEYVVENEKILEFLVDDAQSVPIYGRGGLKDRSGLMEYKYDAV
jgi:hypothetical protein